jgi:cytochrome P450
MATIQEVPQHVPAQLVYDFDYFLAPVGREHPQVEVARELYAKAPPIFYTPRNGGHWVIVRYDDALDVSKRYDLFSNATEFNEERKAYPRMPPIEYDPPEHTKFRKVLGPAFAPTAILNMSGDIRRLAVELIKAVSGSGRCEFVSEIARRFPVAIFMKMVDAPEEDREFLLSLAEKFLRAPLMADRKKAKTEMGNYLARLLDERAQNPGDDILSLIATAGLEDRDLTEEEKVGLATIVFFGGLDTVLATMSFIFHYLGKNPEQYSELVENPALIERGLEDLIRVHSTNCTSRGASHDFEYKGIQFKTGDQIMFLRPVIGIDGARTEESESVKFDRNSSTHLAFGAGVHRCIGSYLARIELRIFLEEWMRRIPEFRVDHVEMLGGIVWSPGTLRLSWNVANTSQ